MLAACTTPDLPAPVTGGQERDSLAVMLMAAQTGELAIPQNVTSSVPLQDTPSSTPPERRHSPETTVRETHTHATGNVPVYIYTLGSILGG